MKVVIDIPEDDYKLACNYPDALIACYAHYIKAGVPLPKKHGRLIDVDALKETLDYYICEANWGDEVNKVLKWVKDEFIDSENTVIEAEGTE